MRLRSITLTGAINRMAEVGPGDLTRIDLLMTHVAVHPNYFTVMILFSFLVSPTSPSALILQVSIQVDSNKNQHVSFFCAGLRSLYLSYAFNKSRFHTREWKNPITGELIRCSWLQHYL